MSDSEFVIDHATDYEQACRQNFVMVDFDERRSRIVDDIGRILKAHVEANPEETGPLVGFGWMP